MSATYDPIADAVSITFKKGKVFRTKRLVRGCFLDTDNKNTPLYLEIIDASKRFKKSKSDLKSFSLKPFSYSKREIRALVLQ